MCQSPDRLCDCALFALQMMHGSCSGGSPLQPLVTAHPPVLLILNGFRAIFRNVFFFTIWPGHSGSQKPRVHICPRVNSWVSQCPACRGVRWHLLLSFRAIFFILFIPLTVCCLHLSWIYTPLERTPWETTSCCWLACDVFLTVFITMEEISEIKMHLYERVCCLLSVCVWKRTREKYSIQACQNLIDKTTLQYGPETFTFSCTYITRTRAHTLLCSRCQELACLCIVWGSIISRLDWSFYKCKNTSNLLFACVCDNTKHKSRSWNRHAAKRLSICF